MPRTQIEIHAEVLEQQRQRLERAMTVCPEMQKRLREEIFQEMKAARDRVVSQIHFKNGDPRGTAHSVKRYVARKYLGGVMSIVSGSKTGKENDYEPPRKLRPGQRGGNRIVRSMRTHSIMHTADRDFILRWVNAGTAPRYIGDRNVTGNNHNRSGFFRLQEQGDGFRGSIAPRNFFSRYGKPALQKAVTNISRAIDDAYNELFNK